jgi:hypothetical protein
VEGGGRNDGGIFEFLIQREHAREARVSACVCMRV